MASDNTYTPHDLYGDYLAAYIKTIEPCPRPFRPTEGSPLEEVAAVTLGIYDARRGLAPVPALEVAARVQALLGVPQRA